MKTFLITPLVVAALATPALADPPDDSITIELEVIETSKKSSQTATFTFAVAEEGACAEATSEATSLRFQVEVCRRRGDARSPMLTFDVLRADFSKNQAMTHRVRASSTLAPGKRAIVGKILRGDDTTEIAVTLRQ